MAGTALKHNKPVKPRKAALRGQSRSKSAQAKKSTAKQSSKPASPEATDPTATEIADREAVARSFFNPTSAHAARAAFLKRQQTADEDAR